MNAEEFKVLLQTLKACKDARQWAADKTLHEVWTTCERGDWLLWLAGRMEGHPGWHTRQQIVLAACACAETALPYVPVYENRPRLAMETARAWTRGEATLEQVGAAADAAGAAADAAYAAAGAAYAAAGAAYAAARAAYAAYAAGAAGAAARAAYAEGAAARAAYAADAAGAARVSAQRNMADLVRRALPEPCAPETL